MGARLSLLAPSAPTVALLSYVEILPDYVYVDVVNNSRFLKTIKAIDTRLGHLVVIKVLIKPQDYVLLLATPLEGITDECHILSGYHNMLPWHRVIETDRAGYLVRQLVRTSLYDRLSLRPFLEPVEKLFMVFQLLKMVEVLHSHGLCHGDLKLENVLVTSSNWLLLTDFAAHTKPASIPEDNPSQYLFYFDTSGRRVCYLAPERFGHKEGLTPQMDLFSLGCVIGELYADGEPVFTLSQLYKYMRGEFSPDKSGVTEPKVAELIDRLLSIDPGQRPLALHILDEYADTFPKYFGDFLYEFLYHLNTITLEDPNVSTSDAKINHIWSSFDSIATHLGFTSAEGSSLMKLNLPGRKNHCVRRGQPLDGGAIIVLNVVLLLLGLLKRPQSKIQACELVVLLSEYVNDEAKLDRLLPYLCMVVDEYLEAAGEDRDALALLAAAGVALTAIAVVVDSCAYISPVNQLLFHEYLVPKLQNVALVRDNLVKMALGRSLPVLAQSARRFWVMAKSFKTSDGTVSELPRAQVEDDIASLATTLLTDASVHVRVCLVNHIFPLCKFFGVTKTNDIVLPHLITYLNDASFDLRVSFLASLLDIAPYVGVISFEQYLLPLLLQTLKDPEPLVTLKVLELFNHFVQTRLINPINEFNALSIYRELLTNTLPLVVHPNEWLRQLVLCLIINIKENLSDADTYCFLYPLIKHYLAYDVLALDWNTLYPCLAKPLSSQVLQAAHTWSTNASAKSLFWKSKLFVINPGKRVVPFSKVGRLVYIGSGEDDDVAMRLSLEDKQWLFKLKAVGLEENDLWKVFALREHIANGPPPEGVSAADFDAAKRASLMPRNIFFDVTYKLEPIANKSKTIETSIDGDDAVSVRLHRDSNLLILPHFSRAKASTQTVEATVFGELELGHSDSHPPPAQLTPAQLTRVFSVSNHKIISKNMRHSYAGTNPHILRYLQKVEFSPLVEDFPEFGRVVRTPRDALVPLEPQGVLMAHVASADVDGIGAVVAGPTSEFFVTGSEKGYVRVWDTTKLEKNITKTAAVHVKVGAAVTALAFMDNRFVLAVASEDGYLRLFRVDVTRGKNKRIIRYNRLRLIRQTQIADTFFTHVQFYGTHVVGTTTDCRIVAYDVITMEVRYQLQNALHHGVPTAFVIGHNHIWLVVATRLGVLSLWDLRFLIRIKSWRVSNNDAPFNVTAMTLLSPEYKVGDDDVSLYFAMIGGQQLDVSIWEVPSFQCREIYSLRVALPKVKSYKLVELDDKDPTIDEIFSELTTDQSSPTTSMLALGYLSNRRGDYIVSATHDRRLLVWNTRDVEHSTAVGTKAAFSRHRVSATLSCVIEKSTSPNRSDHRDVITDVTVVTKPHPMIVSVDRSGCINMYK